MDMFFFLGSTYSYLTVMRIGEAAGAAGIEVRWRPFNVREIMIEMENIPFANKPVKAAYAWRDIERRAARHGLEFAGQPPYPVDPDLLANRVGVVAAEQGWCPEYAVASYRAWFLEKKPLGIGDNVAEVLTALGKDAGDIVTRANSDEIAAKFAAETDAARALGIFGAPTFVVGEEIFWGDDRLEEALEWASR